MNGKELRYWHLLALLTAKAGEWKKAKGVLELADGIAEDMEARLHNVYTWLTVASYMAWRHMTVRSTKDGGRAGLTRRSMEDWTSGDDHGM